MTGFFKRTLPLFLVAMVSMASAANITVVPVDNSSGLPEELQEYIVTVKGSYEPIVGFNAADIGWGPGNGTDEIVGFAFIFGSLEYVKSAELTIDLTPKGASTDELLFADNWSVRGYGNAGSKFYGNQELSALPGNVRSTITFDLFNISITDPYRHPAGFENLSDLLLDGDLNVVYADDAIIHNAELVMRCKPIKVPPVPEERTFPIMALCIGLILIVGRRRRAGTHIQR